jgi:hypothetical protein
MPLAASHGPSGIQVVGMISHERPTQATHHHLFSTTRDQVRSRWPARVRTRPFATLVWARLASVLLAPGTEGQLRGRAEAAGWDGVIRHTTRVGRQCRGPFDPSEPNLCLRHHDAPHLRV